MSNTNTVRINNHRVNHGKVGTLEKFLESDNGRLAVVRLNHRNTYVLIPEHQVQSI